MKSWIIRKVLKGIVFFAVISLAIGFVVMSLWNALLPELFHAPIITFWQAIGLLVLSHILFRGWHGGGHWRGDKWKKRFEHKLESMSPEEREKFKEEWRKRCGWEHSEEMKTN